MMARILIIDDNQEVNHLLKGHLQQTEHEISLVTSTKGVHIESRFPARDLIMISYHYQGEKGWEMFNHIKGKNPALPTLIYVLPQWRLDCLVWIERTIRACLTGRTYKRRTGQQPIRLL